ncbi:DUF4007 family protein [Calidithermus timidus]|jgi:hypothetical protein|uniref:DUF4007 family protein n=1 Tax=Calidithermus timidus TaxID=307124 RepID=UPI000A037A50|nr:DUF4007 family protein [Calidithermus timidus]
MTELLEKLKQEIAELRRGGKGEHKRPHKLVMLLAVLDIIDESPEFNNRVYFDNSLINRFQRHFEQHMSADDVCQPAPPFFHLRSSTFWKHKVFPGKEAEYEKTSTSDGGRSRIDNLIEYAYFAEWAYPLFADKESRQELHSFIEQLLSPMNRIGAVFHESFPLNRAALTQVMKIALDTSKKVNFEAIRSGTNLGANYVKAMPRYAVGTGLLVEKSYRLTELGAFIYDHDPNLNHPSTLWLMHYHLSAPKGPGPAFWHFLVSRQLQPGVHLERAQLVDAVRAFVRVSEGKDLVDRSARSLITVFTGTYTKEDGLKKLGILEKTEAGYQVLEPEPPNEWVVGYALAHYWGSVWPQFRQVALSELHEFGGFANLFLMGTFQLNSRLRELQSRGLLDLIQVAPPHQILRLWRSPADFLPHIYD